MLKKIIVVAVCLLVVVVVYNLGRQIADSLQVSYRLDAETEKLAQLRKQNNELKKKLAEVGSVGFIEQQARDKLGLARAGETVMIIPPSEIDKVLGAQKEVQRVVLPYWQGWLKLFIK